ncbi:MAG: 5'/3'-nucleotidase SurE [Spirochaetaceae bacterium]|nr:MAG: 5'/3'-nucleotidase SurE [Spirochaetaceae bacterium]
MRILLTNDDGVFSPGLEALRVALEPDHEVWVLAPDGERSAMSHYITLKGPVSVKELSHRVYCTSGSPADSVIIGLLEVCPQPADLVISGINIGPNLGTDIIYSGTVAAARQAAIMNVPGIAVSLDSYVEPFHFTPVAQFIAKHAEQLRGLWNHHHFINVNAPNTPNPISRVAITHPCRRLYKDHLVRFEGPRGDTYYFLSGSPVETELPPESDWHAVSNGIVAVSPISIDPINHHDDEAYRSAVFGDAGA